MKRNISTLLGAAFIMATSAIGPGFITQTSKFTEQLGTSFAFVIVISLLLDIIVQLNIWKIVGANKLFAPQLINKVLLPMGTFLSVLIFIGSLLFNIANIAGAALGLQVLLGVPLPAGALISAIIAIGIFLYKQAGAAVDIFAKALGFLMIGLMIYVVIQHEIPYKEVIINSIYPRKIDTTVILTIVGGTVGGYISFSGIHRLLKAGIGGIPDLPKIEKSAVAGIVIATVMRTLLFCAALGVVLLHIPLNPDNPAATVFMVAAGNIGYKLFGLVLWCAAITSVTGSAFTSITFVEQHSRFIKENSRLSTVIFILISTSVFLLWTKPVSLLLFAGAVNGLILPMSLALLLIASGKKPFSSRYHHPLWLKISGWVVVIIMSYMSWSYIQNFFK